MTIIISGNRRVEVEVQGPHTWTPGAATVRIRQRREDCYLDEGELRQLLKACLAARRLAAGLDGEKACRMTD